MSGHAQLAAAALTGGISGGAGGIDAGSSAATGDQETGRTSKTWGNITSNYRSGIDGKTIAIGAVALAGIFAFALRR